MTALTYAGVALVAALFSHSASAACYWVYGPDKQTIYRSSEPPVDMSKQIHETLQRIAPGSVMVFSPSDAGCETTVNELPQASALATPGRTTPRPPRADRG